MDERLTFAIPYYSGKSLWSAIESVLQQEDASWELVICDDSTEGEDIGALSRQFNDPRVRYQKNPTRLGMAGNWNQCLAVAETDLVTILHGDDLVLGNYCGVMRSAARKFRDVAGMFCNATIINENGKKTTSPADIAKRFIRPRSRGSLSLAGLPSVAALLRGNFIMCPTMCYRKSQIENYWFDGRWKFVTDLDLFTRLLMDGRKLVGLPDTAYAYRRHDASATAEQTRNVKRFAEEIDFYNRMAEIGRIRGWSDIASTAQRKRIIRLNLWYCILRDCMGLNPRGALSKWSVLYSMI